MLTIELLPEELDEAVQLYREVVVPAAQRQQGFRAILLMTDRATGLIRSIIVWDSKDDNFEEPTYQNVLAAFNNKITIKSFTREGYDVSAMGGPRNGPPNPPPFGAPRRSR